MIITKNIIKPILIFVLGFILGFMALLYIPGIVQAVMILFMSWIGWFIYRMIYNLHGGEIPDYPVPDFMVKLYRSYKNE